MPADDWLWHEVGECVIVEHQETRAWFSPAFRFDVVPPVLDAGRQLFSDILVTTAAIETMLDR
jgi:hypothetical protein